MGNSSGSQRDQAFSDSCDDLTTYSIAQATEALEYYNMGRQPPRYKLTENGCGIKRLSDRLSESSDIPTTPSTIPTLFRWTKAADTVQLMGSFDGWTNIIPLVNCGDEFLVIIDLPVGEHQYKFLVDGEWTIDADEPHVENGRQSFNNQLIIKESDFEIFRALKADDKTTEKLDVGFGQELPPNMSSHHRPPTIPPQLLQITLNKELPVPCDPEILPVPQTPELNHLYALSIKGGVITMSSMHRYKKKFISTVFYQPT
ncbi:hypothetical protein HELRODRAFT_106804 [Helobdella robusta]|uniref:Association with the SNF1 complex (ASC) domain-containing protein n=1 Tax=Helobdella robusta TaxID=6412 RepID=T1EE51_HELRO|nr:hypothetical protein HELRODRAFT_106804 [Helobdella robusta]ESO02653.1 hypothetical protein HELRODRAFT_106804 [Helobdella robusta]